MGKRLSTAKSTFLARLIADVRAGHAPAAFNAVHAISAATGLKSYPAAVTESCQVAGGPAGRCCRQLRLAVQASRCLKLFVTGTETGMLVDLDYFWTC